jgi:putative membrane protein
VGVFTYPATLIYDRLPAKSKASNTYTTLLMLFWIFLLLASLLAIVVGVAAVPQHLLSPP